MPDILLYLRGGENEELRYAIRSWCKYLEFNKLCVVGGPLPRWFKPDVFISNPKRYSTMRQCYDDLLLATSDRQVGKDIIVMMDDIFLLKPFGTWELNHNRGTLDEQYRRSLKNHANATTDYNRLVKSTDDFLRATYPEPLSFEEHAPFRCDKKKLHNLLKKIGPEASYKLLWRSLYGNMMSIPSERRLDVKVAEKNDFWPTDSPILSTTERSFKGRVGVMLQDRFSKPSKYEK